MVHLRFKEVKTTQAAARLLAQAGGRLPYISLIKLLYLADRQALIELGKPITWDLLVSMPQGPVLSRTLDLITTEPAPGEESYWHRHVQRPSRYDVALAVQPPNDELSPAEEVLLDAVFAKFGTLGKWDLVTFTHTLPEWSDPLGSSVPIEIRDILVAQGLGAEEADAVVQDMMAEVAADELAG